MKGRLGPVGWFVLAALAAGGCSASIDAVVRRQATERLACSCGKPLQIEEITGRSKRVQTDLYATSRYFHANCCGHDVYYECRTFGEDTLTRHNSPDSGEQPAGDVYWRCWDIPDPLDAE